MSSMAFGLVIKNSLSRMETCPLSRPRPAFVDAVKFTMNVSRLSDSVSSNIGISITPDVFPAGMSKVPNVDSKSCPLVAVPDSVAKEIVTSLLVERLKDTLTVATVP